MPKNFKRRDNNDIRKMSQNFPRFGFRPNMPFNSNVNNKGRPDIRRDFGRKSSFPKKKLTEKCIGATEYVNKHKGFPGIIKSRFSDFQVSEINEQGEIAELTDESVPKHPLEESNDMDDEDKLFNKYNVEILPMETWDRLSKMVAERKSSQDIVDIDASELTKEQRTKIHEAVKKAFGTAIIGSTKVVNGKKVVRFETYKKGVRIDHRVKWMWPGDYVYFVMYKENCDTMDAVGQLAGNLKMKPRPNVIGFAGTKDRRAKTSQWVSIRRTEPRRVAAAARWLRPGIRIGNFCFRDTPLRLGRLKGNRFQICLRNVQASDEEIDEACELLKQNGFVNYYGLQRFGTRADMPTYTVGLKILQGNIQGAVESILRVESGPLEGALATFWRASAAAALPLVSPAAARALPIEAELLRKLAFRPRDFMGALAGIPRSRRLLYLHSYQSLCWNRAASHRLSRSAAPLPGDLVLAAPAQLAPAHMEPDEHFGDDSDTEESESHSQPGQTEHVSGEAKDVSGDAKDGNEDQENNKDETAATEEDTQALKDKDEKKEAKVKEDDQDQKSLLPEVKILTQEDIDSGKYTIMDVVLPLPGSRVVYPPNMVDFYTELLKEDGLKLQMRHKYKSFRLSGGYRAVVARPAGVAWRSVRYSAPHADLLLSDADRLDGVTATGETADGKYKALLLSMSLPSSCYATMALRELLKTDTSSENHAQMNNYFKNDKKTENSSSSDTTKSVGDNPTSDTQGTAENTTSDAKAAENTDAQGLAEKRKIDGEDETVDCKKLKQEDCSE